MEKIKAFIAKNKIVATILGLLLAGVTGYLSNSGYSGAAMVVEEAACNELGLGKECTVKLVVPGEDVR